jgi:prepilin-type N-terminal cleavage/methylation domain-containing protein
MKKFHLRLGFTIMELLIAVVVMAALVSISTAGFSQYRDRTAILVDQSNQAVIQAAVKLYAYDNNALPGPLSDLTRDHFDRAYALISDGKRPYTLFAHLQNMVGLTGTAEAVPMPNRYLGENPQKILTCPSDSTPPAKGGVSYGINPRLANQPLSVLLANPNRDLIGETDDIITDSNVDTLRNHLVFRHRGGRVAVTTSSVGKLRTRNSTVTIVGDPDDGDHY